MNVHNFTFWFCAFFLLGVFFISIYSHLAIIFLITAVLFLYFIFTKRYLFSLLVWSVFAGSIYYQVFDVLQTNAAIPFGLKTEVVGIIQRADQSFTKQDLVLWLEKPYSGKIKITSRPFPIFNYGDLIIAEGIIKEPPPESRNYLAKNGILGIANFPKIILIESGHGNWLKAKLLSFKGRILNVFSRNLPSEKAALLSGLTLGERADFSKELKEKMSLSGTTHIVALSGYNISIIAIAIGFIFGTYFSRRLSFYLSVLVITLFVLMTGGEASVVRAAIMGIIGLLAQEAERIFSVRNAIALAAFLMVLINPKVLAFDLGFQLSFAALLGLVYLEPIFRKIFRVRDWGFLKWKKHALATLSAQLAVVPLLLGNFGIFSLTSFLSNILIAEAIPITMAIGFIMAVLGFWSGFLASITALLANLFLSYELWIIDLFSKITLPIATQSFGFFAAVIYYSALIAFIYKFKNFEYAQRE